MDWAARFSKTRIMPGSISSYGVVLHCVSRAPALTSEFGMEWEWEWELDCPAQT